MTTFAELSEATYRLPDEVCARLTSPALVVHLDLVRGNVRRTIELLDGEVQRWRPHVKTTKCPEIWRELTAAGVRHYKCATAREVQHLARHLVDEGVEDGDILLAYPRLGPELARLGELAREFPGVRFSVLSEEAALVEQVPGEVSIFVDVNPGMNRTGLPLVERDAIHALVAAAGARFRGLHFYDGHRHDADHEQREKLMFASYDELLTLVDELELRGHQVEEIITAGTPAFLGATRYAGFRERAGLVHRVSPGTVVLHDTRSEEENPQLGLQPAAVLFTRVISQPAQDRVTCDAGSKSLAAEAGDPSAIAIGHPQLVAESPSEEHLPLRVTSGARPARGTQLYLVPKHVCPTVNLAERCLLVDGGEVVGTAEIAARAHDLLR